MATPNEVFTSSFSVQNVSGSVYAFLRNPASDYVTLKSFGGSIGVGMTQVGFQISTGSIAAFTSALSAALAVGNGYSIG